ncbi:Periplasmic component of amino acid ABC-type transporter/signal transduction system [Cupriavidus taiwanensis]|uniref:Periplasmic component of amino acid ABC-type transporter/signal transduction system n=1 Tax=Cupriavidus taiwanensis TaxID=164546 RepID=A0A375HF10_9BURK|nr:transporter substrate-binding domain-containing protein [Cupriavidus taiwanensis]SOZ73172.1 Periplasmic component of amino acid ABC-type transporter/signal transduction system [Cupriavidus taiwanensis]SOZ73673.1 Periplasmic component of amino acid ABC-type transporter/signal transduction system [Cupriavidus taiwanensis]SOZ75296.1 Periplasmic component of amino acid ABC-type transporter/signal transduction system [Cupriavidus taiwanensis]SPA03775.1 Periplasmic component of amino acid ABC-type
MSNLEIIANDLAPTGKLRASINLGNPLLAAVDAPSGALKGISIDLSNELAARLGLTVEFLAFDAAAKSVSAVRNEEADVGFFAIDPDRGEGIAFSAPYVVIQGSYLVTVDSPLTANEQVDVEGCRVVVGLGSAYDLFLTRELQYASIERAPTSPAVVETFLQTDADVAAGVRQQLEADALRFPNLRLLPGSFMQIQQATGIPASRSAGTLRFLRDFIEEMKASGKVAAFMRNHNVAGATVAPATAA